MAGKLLSIDLDGTLLKSNSTLSSESINTIVSFLKDHLNNVVLLNSGRPMSHMKMFGSYVEKLLDDELVSRLYVASDNGCWLFSFADGDLYKEDMRPDIANALWVESIEKGFNPFLHSIIYSYFGKSTPFVDGIINSHKKLIKERYFKQAKNLIDIKEELTIQKFMLIEDDPTKVEETEKFLKAKAIEHKLNYVTAENRFFMLTANSVTKLTPVHLLCKKHDIPIKQAYAFGDSDNDIPALEGIPNVLVPNTANKEIQKYATTIIGDHNKEGVAKYIATNLLSSNNKNNSKINIT